MTGDKNTGFWNVNVVEGGDYEIRLRRWPEETGKPINAALPPGAPVTGSKAFRETPGKKIEPVKVTLKIGDLEKEAAVKPGDVEVVFNVKLEKGKTRMSALFEEKGGDKYGAYFAYVKKK